MVQNRRTGDPYALELSTTVVLNLEFNEAVVEEAAEVETVEAPEDSALLVGVSSLRNSKQIGRVHHTRYARPSNANTPQAKTVRANLT